MWGIAHDFSKPYLAKVMPWVLSQDSFKTIVRPQIHRAGFQHRQFKHDQTWTYSARIQDVFGVKYQAMILLIYRFASSFTACDCHFGRWLFRSYWLQYNKMGWRLKRCAGDLFCVDMLTDFLWFCHDWKMGAPSLNRHQMPFEMTRRCVNLGTEGNLLDITGEVGNERGASTCIFYTGFVVKWGAFLNFFVRFLKDLLWRPLPLKISWFLPWKNHFRRNLTSYWTFSSRRGDVTRSSLLQWNEVHYPWNLPPRTAQPRGFSRSQEKQKPSKTVEISGDAKWASETEIFCFLWNSYSTWQANGRWCHLHKQSTILVTSVTFWPFSSAFQVVTNTDNTFPFILSHPSTTILPREKRGQHTLTSQGDLVVVASLKDGRALQFASEARGELASW